MNDYEVGVRHNLPFITIIDDNGNITNDCGEFSVSLSHKKYTLYEQQIPPLWIKKQSLILLLRNKFE